MQKRIACLLITLLTVTTLYAQTARYAILPKLARLKEHSGSYTLPAQPVIAVSSGNVEVPQIA